MLENSTFFQYLVLLKNAQFYLELLIPFFCITIPLKKKKYFWIYYIVALLVAIPCYFLPELTLFNVNFSYILLDLVLFGFGLLMFKEKVSLIALYSISAFAIQNLVWNIIWISLDMLPEGTAPIGWTVSFSYFMLIAFVSGLFGFFFYRFQIRIGDQRLNVALLSIGTIIILADFLFSQFVDSWNLSLRFYAILSGVVSISLLFVLPQVYENRIQKEKLASEVTTMEQLIVNQNKQNELSQEIREITNIRIHDIKHQLEFMETCTTDEVKNNIQSLRKQIDLYEGFAKTGYEALDIILTEKSLLCNSKGIRFNYIVDGETLKFLDKSDLVSLFCNMIDNAIEATEKEEGDYRVIKLNVRENKSLLIIECINYAHNADDFDIKNIQSTKKDNGLHGYGLKSIQYVSKKYKGTTSANVVNHLFTLKIVIPLEDKRITK